MIQTHAPEIHVLVNFAFHQKLAPLRVVVSFSDSLQQVNMFSDTNN